MKIIVYLANSKKLLLKEGSKFKKSEILAKNEDYFKGNSPLDVIYTTGKNTKVAITCGDYTYEDSSLVVDSLCEDFTSKITMKKDIVLGCNANIDFIAKKGQPIKTGEPLLTYENDFEDSSLNDLLDKIGDELGEAIGTFSKNSIQSKYTGVVKDVTIYYNHDISEYSNSVQKILKEYISKNKAKFDLVKNTLDKNSTTFVNTKPIEKYEGNKIKGQDVDGLLIEFQVEYEDKMGVGDKVAYGTAIKSVISEVVSKGEEPISEYQPEKVVEAVFSPLSIVSRQTIDIFFLLYLGKAIVGLKDRVREIYEK